MRCIRPLLLSIGLCLVVACTGCTFDEFIDPVDDATLSAARWTGAKIRSTGYRRQKDDPVNLDVAIPVAIDVESFGGNVHIEVDEELDRAEVVVVRQATHGQGRWKEAKASLDAIDYDIDVAPGELGQVVRVRTWTDHAEPHFQRAHVHIRVPMVDGVRVRTQNGAVEAWGIEGQVDIETSYGEVLIATNRPMQQAVTIVNKEADIVYRVRGESTAKLDCETRGGHVISRVRYGDIAVLPGTDSHRYLASLNNGSNPVVMRNVDADIIVTVVHNPMQFGAIILE